MLADKRVSRWSGSETLSLTSSLKRQYTFARERILPGRTRLGVSEGSRTKEGQASRRACWLEGNGHLTLRQLRWAVRDRPSCPESRQEDCWKASSLAWKGLGRGARARKEARWSNWIARISGLGVGQEKRPASKPALRGDSISAYSHPNLRRAECKTSLRSVLNFSSMVFNPSFSSALHTICGNRGRQRARFSYRLKGLATIPGFRRLDVSWKSAVACADHHFRKDQCSFRYPKIRVSFLLCLIVSAVAWGALPFRPAACWSR